MACQQCSFENEQRVDTFFLTTLNLIAQKHGFEIKNVDMEHRIIDLDGPEENRIECTTELVSVLDEYLV